MPLTHSLTHSPPSLLHYFCFITSTVYLLLINVPLLVPVLPQSPSLISPRPLQLFASPLHFSSPYASISALSQCSFFLPSFKLFNPHFFFYLFEGGGPRISFLPLLPVFRARHPSVTLSLQTCLIPSHGSPIRPVPPRLSFSPRRQCFLDRSPGYSSQGIRGPPLGEDVAVTMEVASRAYHRPSIYFAS